MNDSAASALREALQIGLLSFERGSEFVDGFKYFYSTSEGLWDWDRDKIVDMELCLERRRIWIYRYS